jgi:hypothetical protein
MQLILSLKDWVQRENKYLVCCFRPSVKIPCLVLSSSRGRHVFLGVIHAKKKPRQLVGGAHWPDCKSEVREQGDNFQPRKNRRMKPFRTFDKFNVVSEERSRGWLMFPCDTIGGVRPLNLAITPEPAPVSNFCQWHPQRLQLSNSSELAPDYCFLKDVLPPQLTWHCKVLRQKTVK